MRSMIFAAMGVAGLMASAPTAAQSGFQDTSAIDRAVQAFTGKPMGVEGGARTPVDTRLKLASCPMVSMAWRAENHDSVVVTCTGPEWRLYVPVLAPPPPPAPAVIAPVVAAKPEIVIKRGDPITVEVNAAGFAISREGIAMGDAPAGGRLLVDVDGTKKPIQAIAVESGRATLPGYTQ